MESSLISIISLCVAGLAVFVGPFVSMRIANRQIKSATRTTEKQIISPIRQNWINELRMIIVEITSKSAHYWVSGTDNRKDSEYYRITELEHTIRLYINPKEEDHLKLVKLIKQMTNELYSTKIENEVLFWKAHEQVLSLSQKILKREWERVKNDI